jgi:hypothetical protein
MELFLNILWMLIAIALLGTWRTYWVHQRRRTARHSLQEWSAVSVALVLLFFAVSMSDDMHSEIVALEECSANKRDQVHLAAAQPLPRTGTALHTFPWAVASRVPLIESLTPLQNLELVEQVFTPFLPSDRSSGRAPPVSCL